MTTNPDATGSDAPGPEVGPAPGGPEFLRRRARRNRAILFVLAGMVVLFYVLSMVRMGLR